MGEPEIVRAVAVHEVDEDGSPFPGGARLMVPILDQNELWKTREGEVIRLEDMTPSHRFNLLRWLERNADGLRLRYLIDVLEGPMGPKGDLAQADAEEWAEDEMDLDVMEWMRNRPLYRRLDWMVKQEALEV